MPENQTRTQESAVEVATSEGVARITLNRPQRRNALSLEVLRHLDEVVAGLAAQKSIRAVVLQAEGPVFSSGHDLSEMTGRSAEDYETLFSTCTRVMMRIRSLPQPVIARVQGPAVAAGCQLVATCDLAVAAEEATFSTPGVKIGLFCTTPMVPLIQAIPAKAALELLLTGEPISARRALELGLVNRVVAREDLDRTVQRLLDAILASSPEVIRIGKRAFYAIESLSEPEAYGQAVGVMTQNALLADAQEGITAFLQKRPPRWPEA